MKIALIGYGAMGKLIRTLAEEKGHEIAVIINDADAALSADEMAKKLSSVDVAIDFTIATPCGGMLKRAWRLAFRLSKARRGGMTNAKRSSELSAKTRAQWFLALTFLSA